MAATTAETTRRDLQASFEMLSGRRITVIATARREGELELEVRQRGRVLAVTSLSVAEIRALLAMATSAR